MKKSRKKKKKVEMVRLLCTCGKRVKVSVSFAGKMGTCPKCAAQIQIPPLEIIEKVLGKTFRKNPDGINFDIPSLPDLREIVLDGTGEEEAPERTPRSRHKKIEETLTPEEYPEVFPEALPDLPEEMPDEESTPAETLAEDVVEERPATNTLGTGTVWEPTPVEAMPVEAIPEEAEALPVDVDVEIEFEDLEETPDPGMFPEEAIAADIEEIEEIEDVEEAEDVEDVEEAEENTDEIQEMDSNVIIVEEAPSDAMDALPVSTVEEHIWEEPESPLLVDEKEVLPAGGGAMLMQGKQALETDNLDAALQYLSGCIVGQEDLAAAYYLRSLVYLKKKSWDMALEDLENARVCGYGEEEVEKKLNQIRFLRAGYYRNIGAYSQSLADLEHIIASHVFSEKGKVYWTRARFLLRCGAWDTALEDIEKAIQHNYMKPQVYEAGGRISLYRRDYESAMNYLTAAINRGGKNAEIYQARAEAHFFLKNFEDALADVRQAQSLTPELPSLYDLEGLILNEQGRHQDADKAFEKAFGLDPEDPDHYFNRGLAYMRRGKYSPAIEDFTRVIEANPKDHLAYLKRALCYQEKTNPNLAQAREDFKKLDVLEKETTYRGSCSKPK